MSLCVRVRVPLHQRKKIKFQPDCYSQQNVQLMTEHWANFLLVVLFCHQLHVAPTNQNYKIFDKAFTYSHKKV